MKREAIWQRWALAELADLTRRDRRTAQRISRAVDRYAESGHGDIRKLEGYEGRFRLRVGDHRVIFRFADDQLVIVILRVRNRREAYRE